jgi:molybdenum cofactor guanylyltransferase
MGQDKALLRVGRNSMLELALQKLHVVPMQIAPRIAGGHSDLRRHGVIISDLHPGCGPLSGIEAALASSSYSLNLFLPVDMPLLPPGFLTWMLRRAQITGSLATVPRINGLPQPLCAVYRRELLKSVSAALTAGNHKVMSVVNAAVGPGESMDVFNVETVASIDASLRASTQLPMHQWFHNCNTPRDVAEIQNALVLTQ